MKKANNIKITKISKLIKKDLFVSEVEKEENLVKKTCRELGISQKELAERTGYAQETLSRWIKSNLLPKSAIQHIELLLTHEKILRILNKNELAY